MRTKHSKTKRRDENIIGCVGSKTCMTRTQRHLLQSQTKGKNNDIEKAQTLTDAFCKLKLINSDNWPRVEKGRMQNAN